MNFEEARKRFARLTAQRKSGQISEEQFTATVNELRVLDASGVWWQPDPATGGWISWNGTAWVRGTPPQGAPPAQGTRGSHAVASQPRTDEGTFMDLKTFREISHNKPIKERPQRWFDLLSILAGVVTAVLWSLYMSVRASSEGFDFMTPLLLIGIPVVLALYRGRIDEMLLPLQPLRKRLPRLVLLGLGIAMPFLTAFILFNVFGVSNYALLHWNLIIGILLSYAVVREPVLASGGGNRPRMAGRVPLMLLLVCILCVTGAMADDCERDPLNAQDCLRTAGYAQMIAGVVSATSGLFVNVPAFIQAVNPSGGRAGSYEVHDWRQRNETEFDTFVDKKREGYHYDENLDAWVQDSELENLQQQRNQKQQEIDELQKLHDKRVKNQKKNLINATAGALVGGDADKAAQVIKQEEQKLAEENARIKQLNDDINKLDSEISYQKTRQDFHQQK
ncbi:MAG: hypothetical protein QCH35_05065 [Methanomicrobiaceae archaeon]|nr:hypothetical protein [Methanomicrobiaceae archaeon]